MINRLYKLFHFAQPRRLMLISLLAFPPWVQAVQPPTAAGTPIALPELPSDYESVCIDRDKSQPPPDEFTCQELAKRTALTQRAAQKKTAATVPPEELNQYRELLGFHGPYYTSQPSANAVVILPETITTLVPSGGGFSALGLVRNELATQLIGSVTINAKLFNKAGKVIAAPSTEVLVSPLRPGEPAPFELTAPVSFKDVADISWHVSWQVESDKSKGEVRNVIFSFFIGGNESWGARRSGPTPWDIPGHPYYWLETGYVKNNSDLDISNPKMVVAWIDPKNKVLAVETNPIYELTQDNKAISALVLNAKHEKNSELPYAILIKSRKFAERVDAFDILKMIWVTGSQMMSSIQNSADSDDKIC